MLAAIAGVILIGGWLVRPPTLANAGPSLPTEDEVAQLARRAERRSLEGLSDYLSEAASGAASAVVYLPDLRTSGLIWEPRLVVAGLRSNTSRSALIATTTGNHPGQTTVWGTQLPFVVFHAVTGPLDQGAVRRAAAPARPGQWIVAVWRNERAPAYAPGHFLQMAPVTCRGVSAEEFISSISMTRPMAGGGLFDIEGNLFAVMVPCGDRLAAISIATIATVLRDAETLTQRLLSSCGLLAGPLTADEQKFFKTTTGVLIREVWTGSDADVAGLIPGDVIASMNGQRIDRLEDLRPLVDDVPRPTVDLIVRRGAKPSRLAVRLADIAAARTSPAADAGLVWESPAPAYRVQSVVPGSSGAQVGIEAGDRIVRIDQAPPQSLIQIQRLLGRRAGAPVFLEIDRLGRRLGVLLQ